MKDRETPSQRKEQIMKNISIDNGLILLECAKRSG
jgi:hypothetical protein